MGFFGNIFGKISGKPRKPKTEVQITEILDVMKDNEKLRNELTMAKVELLDRTDNHNTKEHEYFIRDQQLKENLKTLNERIRDLEDEKEILKNDIERLSKVEDDIDNPTRSVIFSILRYRPKIRTVTIAELLNISDRTVREYRKEYRDIEKQN